MYLEVNFEPEQAGEQRMILLSLQDRIGLEFVDNPLIDGGTRVDARKNTEGFLYSQGRGFWSFAYLILCN